MIVKEAMKYAHLLPEVVSWISSLFKKKKKETPKAITGIPRAAIGITTILVPSLP